MAANHDEEFGYRRGFDQGIAAVFIGLGLEDSEISELTWKKRIAAWRHGRAMVADPFAMTAEEIAQLRRIVKEGV